MRVFFLLMTCVACGAAAQTRMIVVGNVYDSNTKEPLAFATIGVKGHTEQTITNGQGHFELAVPVEYEQDTLRITYIGYHTYFLKIASRQSVENIYLEEAAMMLEEVTVVHRKLNLRDTDRSMRKIRDNLYAMTGEVTNAEYNSFLGHLEEFNQREMLKKCDFDLSAYSESEKKFFTRYSSPFREGSGKDSVLTYKDYPAVNVPYEGAVQFCEWLTEQYNANTKKKKFKKVKFRLPTLKEWQISALGCVDFQTWDLRDVEVDVIINPDTTQLLPNKGKRIKMKVGEDIWFPWYTVPHYQKKPYNNFYCYLGNFKVTTVYRPCPRGWLGFDGWIMMGRTESYFPNNFGLYDVVGNVAEMIDENGKACGGSWNDLPENSTIHSVKNYARPDATVGFRVFMEVIEP